MDISINFWVVAAAAVANMIVGTVWYGPGFGKAWRRLMGFTLENMKKMPLTPRQAMGGGLVTALLLSGVLFWLSAALGAETAGNALALAFWTWLGFAVPFTAGAWLWEGKSFRLFVFNAAQWLVSFSVMSLVVTIWR